MSTEFKTLDDYLSAFKADQSLSVIPIPLVAEHLNRTAPAVSAMLRAGTLDEIIIGKNRFVSLASIIERETNVNKDLETVEQFLIGEAKKGTRAVFYGPVMESVGMSSTIPSDRVKIGNILDKISRKSNTEKGVLLSVLVHRKTAGLTQPGPGFFNLARSLGYKYKEQDISSFIEEQTDRVIHAYAE